MIQDPTVAAEIRDDWKAVRTIERGLRGTDRSYLAPGFGQIQNIPAPAESYNLPFVLAFSVLDKVLSELIAQSTFACADWKLGAKMHASQGHVPWQDFTLVDQGRLERNELAHKAKLVPRDKCLEYVNAIEAEFLAWGIL